MNASEETASVAPHSASSSRLSSPPSSKPVQAWLVDLDGTLYHAAPLKKKMALQVLFVGPHRARLLSAFRHLHEELRAQQKIDPCSTFLPSPFDEQLQRAATHSGKSVNEVRSIVAEWMIERPCKIMRKHRRESLIAEIEAFRASGGKTAVVSDYPAQQKLDALELKHLFDVVVASGETDHLTRLKPAPDGYLLAARQLNVSPEHCLVIGDRDDADGAAARAAEMQFRLI